METMLYIVAFVLAILSPVIFLVIYWQWHRKKRIRAYSGDIVRIGQQYYEITEVISDTEITVDPYWDKTKECGSLTGELQEAIEAVRAECKKSDTHFRWLVITGLALMGIAITILAILIKGEL